MTCSAGGSASFPLSKPLNNITCSAVGDAGVSFS